MRNKKKPSPESTIKREHDAKEIGEIFDVNDETVRRWAADGCPHRRDTKRKIFLNDGEVRAWLEAEGKSAAPGRPPKPRQEIPDDLGGNRDYWLARKYRNQCLEDEKRLVDKEKYRALWINEVVTIKNKCRGLGAGIAPQCVGLDAGEIQGIIEGRIEQIFRELSEGD
jgi:hypothetical protein